jgi:hypothetical protein
MGKMPRRLFAARNVGLEQALTEGLYCCQSLRTLGFSADDIYMVGVPLSDGTLGVRILLRAQGKEFIMDVGAVHGSFEKVQERWQEMVERNNHASDAESDEFLRRYRASETFAMSSELVIKLVLKGFSINPDNLPKARA